jgi:hypothetical protein
MRATWLIPFAGVLANGAWFALELFAAWPYFEAVAPHVLRGSAVHVEAMCRHDKSCPDYVFSTGPSLLLGLGVGLSAFAVAVGAWWLERRMLRRSLALRPIHESGQDYRSTSSRARPEDTARAQRRTTRAFQVRLGLVTATALAIAAWSAVRLPPGPFKPGVDDRPGIEVAARRLTGLLEGMAMSAVALTSMLAIWPSRRRLGHAATTPPSPT